MLKNISAEEQLYTQLAEMIEKEKDNEAFSLPSIAEIKASGFSPAAIAAKNALSQALPYTVLRRPKKAPPCKKITSLACVW